MKQVEIPNDYFYKMSKKDYSQFETALVREFFQNSYDANAKQFVIDYNEKDKTLTIFDDGDGMNYDTIVNKLLVMGESHKTNENAVGAFGHAKILLYFSWPKWEIQTQNYIVTGSSHYYSIEETDDYIDGTISTIKFEEDQLEYFQSKVRSFFKKCDTTCKVFFNETTNYGSSLIEVKQDMKVGEKIYEDVNFDIFKSDKEGYYISVRQNGILMFEEFISGNSKKEAIVELKKRPEFLLLQNRDYFNSSIATYFNKLKRELSIDSIDTFSLNHDTKENIFNVFGIDVGEDDDTEKRYPKAAKIVTHYMKDEESLKEINRRRSKRIINIAYAYVEILSKYFPVEDIVFGYTKKENTMGLWRKNNSTGENEIYINIDHVTIHSPNYRKMSIILLNLVMHELAHAVTFKNNGCGQHDENFIKTLESMRDLYWDNTVFTKEFKRVWKQN